MKNFEMNKKIKEFWKSNYTEIVCSVINEEQNAENRHKSKQEIKEKIEKKEKNAKITLGVGIVYVLAGIISLYYTIHNNLSESEPQMFIMGWELLILGIYALLHTAIFSCVYGKLQEAEKIKKIFVGLMLPYHLCIKSIKKFLKEVKQEHVAYLIPYYLISIFLVAILYIIIAEVILTWHLGEAYNELVAFVIVCCLLWAFFKLVGLSAYICTRSIIKSIQKNEVKSISKKNWRSTLKNSDFKMERYSKFRKEWGIVKQELECTKLYAYIILTIFVLCIPKTEGSFGELLINQFLGVTTIAALAREVKGKEIITREQENREQNDFRLKGL